MAVLLPQRILDHRIWRERDRFTENALLFFAVSRLWRLMPLYWLCYAITIAARLATNQLDAQTWSLVEPGMAPANAGRAVRQPAADLRPTWSLDIELQFYILAPFVATSAFMAPRRALLAYSVAFLIHMAAVSPATPTNVVACSGFFLFGAIVHSADWRPDQRVTRASFLATLLAAALFAIAIVIGRHSLTVETFVARAYWPLVIIFALAVPFAAAACQACADWSIVARIAMLPIVWGVIVASALLLHVTVDHWCEKRREAFVAASEAVHAR